MSPAALLPHSAYHSTVFASAAVSDEARSLDDQVRELLDVTRGFRFGQAQDRLRAEIGQLLNECSVPDWDGSGAHPALPQSARWASSFLSLLPLGTPLPEAGVDPDGEIVLEWHAGARYSLSISFGRDGSLTYAALFGSGRLRGRDVMGDEIPPEILSTLHRLFAGGPRRGTSG